MSNPTQSNNPLYPLPADYESLTRDGQRLARVAACGLGSTPEDDVLRWAYWRTQYLQHPEAYFYDDFVEPSPKHYEWAYCRRRFKRNVISAHRGSAKSTVQKEFQLRTFMTERNKQLIVLADDSKVERRFDDIMAQLEHNPRIRDDFGRLRPDKNEGVWNRHALRGTNGAQLLGYSASSKNLRGERPKYLWVDDIERDMKEAVSIEKVVEDMDQLIFTILLPMLRAGAHFWWQGTPVDRRLYLWKFIKGEDDRIDTKAWNRRIYEIVNEQGEVFWPAEFTPETLEAKKKELGWRWYAEMMCQPGTGRERVLSIPETSWYGDPQTDAPFLSPEDPLASQAPLSWTDIQVSKGQAAVAVPRTMPAGDLYRSLYRFLTVDYAWTANPSSDRSCVHVMGADRNGQLWSLDLWSDRKAKNEVIRKIWEMAIKWKVRLAGVEAVALQFEFFKSVQEKGLEVYQRLGWSPQVIPIKYPHGVEKQDRIASLSWLLNAGRIKLPRWRAVTRQNDPYARLFDQIKDFTEDLGLLEHDDEVDTLAMAQEIIKTPRRAIETVTPMSTPADYLRAGKTTLPGGMPVTAYDLASIPMDAIDGLLGRYAELPDRRIHWEEGGI